MPITLTIPNPVERTLFLAKQVDQASMNELSKAILDINESDVKLSKIYAIEGITYNPKPIKIYIDSYGGYVYQCLGLLNIMEKSVVPVHTITTGCAMSCGFIIHICGHKRFAYENSTFMYHQVSSVAWGKLKDMEEDVIETKRLQNMIEKITLSKTKMTKEDLQKAYEGKKDWYITTSQALKMEIVDEKI